MSTDEVKVLLGIPEARRRQEGIVKATENVLKRCGDVKKRQENDLATELKKELEKQFGTRWQVIVGRNFGARVSFDKGFAMEMQFGQLTILVFRTS